MKFLLVHLFYLVGQPEPEAMVEFSLQSRTHCEAFINSASYGSWNKLSRGKRDDGRVVERITSQCVPVLDEDVQLMKEELSR